MKYYPRVKCDCAESHESDHSANPDPNFHFLSYDEVTHFKFILVSLIPGSMILGRGGNCRVYADRAGSSPRSDWDEAAPPDSPHVCRAAFL